MRFTDYLWKTIDPIFNKIIEHPFIKELTEGALPLETFQFYIQQDSLYLADFAKALGIAGTRAGHNQRMQDFFEFAIGGLVVERELHEKFFKEFNIDPDVNQQPACFAYTRFLLSVTALKSYQEGVAALLPCFWIYGEVGKHIIKKTAPNNPYQAWIDTYAGEEFNQAVQKAIEITDEAAEHSSDETKQQMEETFVQSTKLEWNFWNAAYEREHWKI